MKLIAISLCLGLVSSPGFRACHAQFLPPALEDSAVLPATAEPTTQAIAHDASAVATNVDETVGGLPAATAATATKFDEVPSHLRGRESPHGPVGGRYAKDGCQRAGCPTFLSRFAMYSVSDRYSVGYVGGGSPLPLFGEPRTVEEGTFGFDYRGWHWPRITWLKWNHGSRYQGGYGAYASDGPRLLPE
jgi:hypothetical protein